MAESDKDYIPNSNDNNIVDTVEIDAEDQQVLPPWRFQKTSNKNKSAFYKARSDLWIIFVLLLQ
jgi:hypothetical protein